MMHILLGLDPTELGAAPFALATREAVDLKARELGLRLHAGANLHVLPAEAGHVRDQVEPGAGLAVVSLDRLAARPGGLEQPADLLRR